ncbi:malonate decarboxylase holo-[acyl-carrier-protein] synthase [Massilia eurypsychrophila]|uniref:Malonate decarboxylase holo-[acyl-carrier-protein] synthase n=1 Tax=Massilia eurypsychrophila TaxID=1485217 RepID=A0A2G8TFY2_9BURK|nr:malonate decarboxylase holo-[acyl-carrier-protein] synthase [Massilia eurypsychrophila]PIL44955.1 malonate decarboxylase holo-[acyl-carrier-protein] synthase [Massilia eurypsychrophila]
MFCRHDLVWLTGRGWDAAFAGAAAGQHAAVDQWRREDWPAVVRRADPGLAPLHVSLGIPWPPASDGTKGRIAFNASSADVARHSDALALEDASAAAPERWRPALKLLADRMPLRAYGSLAMQALTGQTYLTATSDIDVLFFPTDGDTLCAGLALLERHAALLPLDGEIVFPTGAAVSWKEWIGAGPVKARVLVKDAGAVRLAPMADLLATLEAA